MNWVLYRLADGPDGTLGMLQQENSASVVFATLEEENERNESWISRIPAGTYACRRTRYYAGGYDTFEITGVPGRSRILFHIGNTEEDSAGCVLVGMQHGLAEVRDEDTGEMRLKAAVLQSRMGFAFWMERLRAIDEFTLRVIDPGYA